MPVQLAQIKGVHPDLVRVQAKVQAALTALETQQAAAAAAAAATGVAAAKAASAAMDHSTANAAAIAALTKQVQALIGAGSK